MSFSRAPIPLLVIALAVAVFVLRTRHYTPSPGHAAAQARVGCRDVERAYAQRATAIWLTAAGTVSRVLPDSTGRLVHQRFLLACPGGLTILIDNDVSIGQRAPVHDGSRVAVHGQYVWNPQGGLIHYTHHDDRGSVAGWVYLNGRVYG